MATSASDCKFLIFGKTGWVGNQMAEFLTERGLNFEFADARLEDRAAIQKDLDTHKPTHVLQCAGVIGKPNVDWCETNRKTVVKGNVLGCLNLVDLCSEQSPPVHVTYFGTGCIFEFDGEKYPWPTEDFVEEGSIPAVKETDTPNFKRSYYSNTKAILEELLAPYDNVLTLRVRMPIVADLENKRNFITKIVTYDKVVNVANSMTVFPELLPLAIDMAARGLTGQMNFCNPGAISHNGCLQLYKEYIDPEFTWKNFTVEEQSEIIKAPRSNTILSGQRLMAEFPDVLPIKESLIKYVFEPARDAMKAKAEAAAQAGAEATA